MKTALRLATSAILFAGLGHSVAVAQQTGLPQGPTSKIYLAEVEGEGQITSGGRVYEPRQATAFGAPGTLIETRQNAHQAYVYSNGTGMFVDELTRVEVARFVQEPFTPNREATLEIEPSISQSDIYVAQGQVGVCTSQLISGSTMTYATPHGMVNIRNGKLAIKVTDAGTTFYLLEGDATVQSGDKSVVLQPGEQADITSSANGSTSTIAVSQIERELLDKLDDMVTVACNVKKTVTFETLERAGNDGTEGTEIVAVPTTPTNQPTNLTVSPDRLRQE